MGHTIRPEGTWFGTARTVSKLSGENVTHRNARRTLRRAAHEVKFIGIDGEGVTRADGTHDYVLLSVGDRSLYHTDGSRLGWREIFSFLYDCFEANPDAAYVGFYLGYDFTQWLREIPEERARVLLTKEGIARRKRTASGMNPTPFPLYLDDWELDMLGERRLKLRPHIDGKNRLPWLYICDAGPFFQTSFLAAIDPKQWHEPIVTEDEFATLARGKEARAIASFDADMIEYNVLENAVMARLMHRLNLGLLQMGVRLRRHQWFGPGQSAAAWLNTINAPTGQDIKVAVPEGALDAARKSYFGGWFEDFAHGHIPGTTYDYDINSAYPFIISRLPCLKHGRWTHRTGNPGPNEPGTLRLVYALVKGTNEQCGAMLHRTPTGRVCRPQKTRGWYWHHEIDAARRAGILHYCRITEWWQYDPCACPPPLAKIAELYMLRLQVGKKTPAGRAYRIVYNSAYGKHAQSIGKPKYANPVYASLITAGCRTMILDAIATHPDGIRQLVKVATDGVCFQAPHPSLDLDPELLGAWSGSSFQNLTTARPGIYWDDETRRRVRMGESPKLKSRGINARDLANVIAEIDRQFDEFDGDEQKWPIASIPVLFDMVSMRQALSRGKWQLAGVVSKDAIRVLTTDPIGKRTTIFPVASNFGEFRSLAFSYCDPFDSTPYEGRFGDELRAQMDDDGLTPEGSVWDMIRIAMTS